MRAQKLKYAIGSRVRMNALGASRSPKIARRVGKVVGANATGTATRVVFDGDASVSVIHNTYLETAAD